MRVGRLPGQVAKGNAAAQGGRGVSNVEASSGPLPINVLPSFGGSHDGRMSPVRVKTWRVLDMYR